MRNREGEADYGRAEQQSRKEKGLQGARRSKTLQKVKGERREVWSGKKEGKEWSGGASKMDYSKKVRQGETEGYEGL